MKISSRVLVPSVLVALIACSADANAPCPNLPCPLPFAVDLTVTSAATGAAVPNVSVAVTGAIQGGAACDDQGHCIVPGGAGTYNLSVSAPGFASVARTIQVQAAAAAAACGCGQGIEQHVAIALSGA